MPSAEQPRACAPLVRQGIARGCELGHACAVGWKCSSDGGGHRGQATTRPQAPHCHRTREPQRTDRDRHIHTLGVVQIEQHHGSAVPISEPLSPHLFLGALPLHESPFGHGRHGRCTVVGPVHRPDDGALDAALEAKVLVDCGDFGIGQDLEGLVGRMDDVGAYEQG